MNQEELAQKYLELHEKFQKEGFNLTDEEIETLCLNEAWKDGAGWDTVQELYHEHVYLNRQFAIDQLENVYGYKEPYDRRTCPVSSGCFYHCGTDACKRKVARFNRRKHEA